MDKYSKWDINVDKIFPTKQIRSCPIDTKLFNEADFSYTPIDLTCKNTNLFINGYFQSWKHSCLYIDELRGLFRSSIYIKPSLSKFYNELISSSSLFFHIRRGDYVKYKDIHFNVPIDSMITFLNSRIETQKPHIICGFSDDLEIIDIIFKKIKFKDVIKINASRYFNSQLDEFILMSACRDSIIANSTFSWWAAHLNSRKDKFVAYPKIWFSEPQMNNKTANLSPPEWTKY